MAALTALAGIGSYVLQGVIAPGPDRLPGNDAVNLYFWEVYTRQALAAESLPFWNPFHMSGSPHLSDTQTTVLYPPAMLLRLLPPMAFLPWMAALHVWFAGAGGLFLARVLGLGWMTGIAAAVAVMLGGSVGPWLHNGHLLVLYCAAWLPWALALAIVSVRRGGSLPHPALVIVMVVQFLAGYLQGSLYVGAAVAAYFIYCSIVPVGGATGTRWRPLVQLAILGVCALGLSAFQLLPLIELTAAAGRTSGLPYSVASDGGLRLADLARLIFPFRGVAAEPVHRLLPDALTYVGGLLIVLAPFAFLDRSRRHVALFLALVASGAIAFASAGDLPLYRIHHFVIPGLRVPGRLLFLATVTLAALGAIGLEAFVDACRLRAWRRLAPAAAVATSLLAGAAAITLPRQWAVDPSHVWPVLPLALVSVVVGVALFASFGWRRAAIATAACFVAFDLVAFAAPAAHSVPLETPETMRRVMGEPDHGRAVSVCENRIGPGEFLVNGQATLDGLAAMHLADYADWAALAKAGEPPPHDGLYRRIGSEGLLPARPDLLNQANVSLVYSCEPITAPNLTLISHIGPIYRYRNEAAWPRAFWTCDAQETTAADATAWLLNGRYDDRRVLVHRPSINVRWRAGITDEQRQAVERRRRLLDGVRRDGDTWRYALGDWSQTNVLALMLEPVVDDTAGVDRRTGEVPAPALAPLHPTPGGGYWVIGSRPCADSAIVRLTAADRADGVVALEVDSARDGYVFLSEAYYPARRAFVDGQAVHALRANLAFTAIPVPAGQHRVELRYVPRSFQAGLGISALTLAAFIATSRMRPRGADLVPPPSSTPARLAETERD